MSDYGKLTKQQHETNCISCGVSYTDHMGLVGVCRQLQEAKAKIEQLKSDRDTAVQFHTDEYKKRVGVETWVDGQDTYSDFQTATEMRNALQEAKATISNLNDMVVELRNSLKFREESWTAQQATEQGW